MLLLAVFLVRSPFFFGEVLGNDAAYHAHAAVTVLNGGWLYRDTPYTYPPLYAYTEALAIQIFGNTGLGWKATAQIYDLGILILIYLIVNRISNRNNALIAAAFYGFLPLPFYATSSFASFDSTAAFWMLATLLLLMMKKPIPSAIALGIGTAYKYFPLVLLPVAIVYLSTKRQKIQYSAASIATIVLIQLPFILTEFTYWLNNVILYHVNRGSLGATIYNLISFHPQLWDLQSPFTILSPITLALAFILIALSEGKSNIGLIKNSAFVMVAAVFFSKVVLFYALWYVPLICLLLVAVGRRTRVLVIIPFLTLQLAMVMGGYFYNLSSSNLQTSLITGYVYLLTSGLLLLWLMRDRLHSAKRNWKLSRKFFRDVLEKTSM